MSYIEYFHAHPTMAKILADLQQVLGFTDGDLELNRVGVIGPDQKRVLLRKGLVPPAVAVASGLLASFGIRLVWTAVSNGPTVFQYLGRVLLDLFTLNVAGVFRELVSSGGERLPAYVIALVLLPIPVALLQIRRRSIEALFDLVMGVAVAYGKPNPDEQDKEIGRMKRNRETTTTHYYVLSGHKFEIPPAAREAIIPGVAYCLYYGKASKSVLAAEPIPEEDVQIAARPE